MGLKGGAAVAAVVGNEVAGSHLPSPVQKAARESVRSEFQ